MTRPKGGRSSIFVANVDGTGGYSLVNDDYIDQAPAWSPDGTQLAFVSYRAARLPGGETGYPGTFIMDADDTAGTTVRQVGDVFDVEPDWSPDGTQLAVSNTAWTGGLLRLIDVSTGVGTALENAVFGQHPKWLPNGNSILLQYYDASIDLFVILVVDISGTSSGSIPIDGYFPVYARYMTGINGLSPLEIQDIQISSTTTDESGNNRYIQFYSQITISFTLKNISDELVHPDGETYPVTIIRGLYGTVEEDPSTDEALSFIRFSPDEDSLAEYQIIETFPAVNESQFNDGDVTISLSQIVGSSGMAPGESRQIAVTLKVEDSGQYRYQILLEGHLVPSLALEYPNGELYPGFSESQTVAIEVPMTYIDFNDRGLQAMMFWAIYNESSEGRNITYNPGSSCYDDSHNLDDDIQWLVYGDGGNARCHDAHYLEVQTFVNGLISVERHYGTDQAYTYFTNNFKGSLGNDTSVCSLPDVNTCTKYDNDDDPVNDETNMIWMNRACWPDGVSYATVFGSSQSDILSWHRRYLGCVATLWDNSAIFEDTLRSGLYESVYGLGNPPATETPTPTPNPTIEPNEPIGVIPDTVSNFEAQCRGIDDVSLPTYLQCDPTNGAFSRKFATYPNSTKEISYAMTCSGDSLQNALSGYAIQIANGLDEYKGLLQNYEPDDQSVLQPVLRIDYYRTGAVYLCTWVGNVYQQLRDAAGNLVYYPR